jgi:hypothetical protein
MSAEPLVRGFSYSFNDWNDNDEIDFLILAPEA